MLRFLPFLSLFLLLAGWMPLTPTAVDPPGGEPGFSQPADLSTAHDDGDAHGKIDPHG